MDLDRLLKSKFGFDHFRGIQRPVIEAILKGEHSLVIMPTGMGKSLCYQLPSEVFDGLTLVISPLIALMKDQVDAARKKGLNATFINSSLSTKERQKRYQRLRENKLKLLYVTPERFRKSEFLEALSANKVDLLAVDEAHCISQWGHDFRPDYTRISEFRKLVGNPVTIALTATATPEVQDDIVSQLGLRREECRPFIHGIERPNLNLKVEDIYGIDQKIQMSLALRHHHPGAAIIYFSLISTLEEFARALAKLEVPFLKYHGNLPPDFRKRNQDQFLASDDALILATPAFGLGVDKSNIRMVAHAEIPGSIEAYYQEVGRAGRDGMRSECVLLYDPDDVSIQMDFIKWANPDPGFIHKIYHLIAGRFDEYNAGGLDFLREQMNFYNRRDFRVETSVNLLERWGCIERSGGSSNSPFQAIMPPLDEVLDVNLYAARLKRQNEKLLEMVNYAKLEGELKAFIYSYFGVTHSEEN